MAYTEFRYKNLKAELHVRIRACEGAHVVMYCGANHVVAARSYDLVIGGHGNTNTYIVR